jgi:hypothetical protein
MFKNSNVDKKEKNKNEWDRLNNNWKKIRNENKKQQPELYNSGDSDENIDSENNTNLIINIKTEIDEHDTENNSKILKRCGSSYDELLSYQDCIITEKNEIKCDTPIFHDGVEDSKTHFTSSVSSCNSTSSHNYFDEYDNDNDNEYFTDTQIIHASKITMEYIKNKYCVDNTPSLEVDYSINYNMKMLTHLGNYYNIIANNNANKSFFNTLTSTNKNTKSTLKTKPTPPPKKMLKSDLIKNIVLFETNEFNHPTVLRYRKMLEYIDELKSDKYFSTFVLFP